MGHVSRPGFQNPIGIEFAKQHVPVENQNDSTPSIIHTAHKINTLRIEIPQETNNTPNESILTSRVQVDDYHNPNAPETPSPTQTTNNVNLNTTSIFNNKIRKQRFTFNVIERVLNEDQIKYLEHEAKSNWYRNASSSCLYSTNLNDTIQKEAKDFVSYLIGKPEGFDDEMIDICVNHVAKMYHNLYSTPML